MRYGAAVAAFVVAYIAFFVAYGELAPQALNGYFRDRPGLLGRLILLFCFAAAVITFLATP